MAFFSFAINVIAPATRTQPQRNSSQPLASVKSCSEESFDEFEVQPKAGLALFFEHSVRHKGMPILEGRKYVLRTDVMYSVDPEEAEEDEGNWDDE